jgi:hypothetical protein
MEKLSTVITSVLLGTFAAFIWSAGAFAATPLGIQGDVTVQNDTSNPVPVTIESPVSVQARELVEYSCLEQMSDGQDSAVCDFGEMVPEGSIFVMEFFYGRANQQSNSVGVQYVFNFQNRFRFFPPPTVKTRAGFEFSSSAVHQQLRSLIYNTGLNISVFAFRRSAAGPATVQARISGYLIDAP